MGLQPVVAPGDVDLERYVELHHALHDALHLSGEGLGLGLWDLKDELIMDLQDHLRELVALFSVVLTKKPKFYSKIKKLPLK